MNLKLPVGVVLAGALCCGCSSTSAGSSSDGGSGGGSTSSSAAYNDLKGTFTAPGVSATISGAVFGTYQDSTTQWNAAESADLVADESSPTAPTVTATLPSGETAQFSLNLGGITTMPAAGTFSCSNLGDYQLNVSFQIYPQGGMTAIKQWGPGTASMPCTMTLEAPMSVTQTASDGQSYTGFFAHGSMTATLANLPVPGGTADGTTGQLALTW